MQVKIYFLFIWHVLQNLNEKIMKNEAKKNISLVPKYTNTKMLAKKTGEIYLSIVILWVVVDLG